MLLPRSLLSLLVCLTLAPLSAGAVPVISTTFDSDLDGWTAVGLGEPSVTLFPSPGAVIPLADNAADMEFSGAGGNPGGFAKFVDVINEPSSIAMAPGKFLGDLTDYIGGTFSFQHNLIMEGLSATGFAPYSLIIASGPVSVGNDILISPGDPNTVDVLVWTFPAPSGPTGWVNFDITLDLPANGGDLDFLVNKNLQDVNPTFPSITPSQFGFTSDRTFEEIMANVTFIGLAFEIVDNENEQMDEMGGIDNIFLTPIPEPTTGTLLALGLAGLALRARRS